MGNCASSNDDHGASAHSAAIDRQIEEDSKIFRKECKILLLGKSPSFNSPQPAVRVRPCGAQSSARNGVTALSYPWPSLARETEPTLVNVDPPSSDQLLRSLPTNE